MGLFSCIHKPLSLRGPSTAMTSSWREFGSSQRQGVEDPLERNKKDEEERKRQQAEQQRRQAEELKKKQQEEAARTRNPLAPLQQALSQDAVKPILQGIDRTFGTSLDDLREQNIERAGGREAIKQRQKEINQAFDEEANKGANIIGSEAIRAVIRTPVNLLEGVLNTGELIKDTVSAPFQKDPKRNPFDRRYVQAAYDFKVEGPKTPVGKLAEGLLTFGVAMRQAAVRLPKAAVGLGTGGKGIKGAIASGIIPGALADFMLAKPGDGNLSNLVQDIVPEEYRDTFLFALATNKDDDPWTARLKTVLEGAGTGAALDTLVYLKWGRNATQRALKAGKSQTQAIEEGLKAADAKRVELEKELPKKVEQEGLRWSDAQQKETERLLERENFLLNEEANLRTAGLEDTDPNLQRVVQELEQVRLNQAQLDSEIIRGYDPEDITIPPQERSATVDTADVNRVVAQQLELERGPIPDSARVPDVPSTFRTNQAALGGSDHILTDAAYRILNLDDEVENFVRQTTRRTDLQTLAKSLGRSTDSIVSDAARIVQEVRDASRQWNDPTDNIADLLKRSGAMMEVRGATDGTSGDMLTREGVVALKALITDTSNQIFDLALNADKALEARLVGGNQFDRMVDRLVTMLGLHKQAAVFHGGGLQAFGLDLMGGIHVRGDAADDSVELTMRQAREWAAKVKELKRIGDPEAQDQLEKLVRAMALAGGNPTKAVNFTYIAAKLGVDELMNGMYNSILSGPITHLRNVIGNGYALLERPTSIMLRGVFNNDETLRRSAMAGYHGIASSIQEAWQVGWTSMKTGDSVNLNAKFVIEDAQALAGIERLKMAAKPGSGEERAAGFVEALYRFTHNPIISLPSRMMIGADDFFKTLTARQKVQTDAMYKAMSEAKNADDVDGLFDSYMKEFSKKIDPTTGRILDPTLLEYAERATFQQDPGSQVNAMANWLNNTPFGIGRIFVPFIRTPANILAYAGQHTPGLARFLTQYKEAIRTGDELLIAELKGREAIGAMTVGIAGFAAANGLITGNGPVDPEERAIWLQTHRPMSIKLGDAWVSYQPIEPLSTIMATIADIAMLGNMGAANAAERLAGQVSFAIAAAVTEKSYLAGLAGISDILDPRNMTADGVTRGLLSTANNFLPFSGARRGLANAIDPYMKEVDGELKRALNAALPGYKLLGPTKVDFLTGQNVSSSAGGVYNAISPIRYTAMGEDPVKDMLVDINYELKDVVKTGPMGVELTGEQRRMLSQEMYGNGVRQRLERLMNQDWFKEDLANWKARGLNFSTEDNRPRHYQAVQRIINQSKESAFRAMQSKDPGFANMVMKARQEQVKSRRGIYTEVTDLTNYPN